MTLEHLFQKVESRLYDLGRWLCRNPLAEVREEADEVVEALERRRDRLYRCREELAELRRRVRAHEDRAALLASRVESFVHVYDGGNAFQHALDLDDLRRSLTRDRERLRKALREEGAHLDRIRELEQRLGELQDKLCCR
jgi:hypothetical protein